MLSFPLRKTKLKSVIICFQLQGVPKKCINKKLLFGVAHHFNSEFLNLFGFSKSVSYYHLKDLGASVVSQLSKCVKFMTFREGCFVICNWMQVLKCSS